MSTRQGDNRTARKTRRKINDFNRRHPETPITSDTIDRSFKQHRATDLITEQLGGITISPNRIQTLMKERMTMLDEDGLFDWN